MDLLWVFFKRSIQIKTIFFTKRLQDRARKTILVCTGLPAKDSDRTLIDRKGRIRDHQLFCELHLISESETLRAGTERIVKRKTSGFDFLDADPAVRAGKALTEIHRFPVDHIHH